MKKSEDKLFEMFSELNRSLRPSEGTVFDKLVNLFDDLSFSLQFLLTPFILQPVFSKEKVRVLNEEIASCKDYVLHFGQLLRFLKSFDKWLLKSPIEAKDEEFALTIDKSISEVVDFYDKVVITGPADQVKFINQSYSTFLMGSRMLNTAIRLYNQKFQKHQIQELKNIPDPKYFDFKDSVNLKNYIDEIYEKRETLFPKNFLKW